MAYKLSVTTKITIEADTAEEASQVYQHVVESLPASRPIQPDVLEGQRATPIELPTAPEQPPHRGEAEPSLQEEISAYLAGLRLVGRTQATCKYYADILGRLADRFDGRPPSELGQGELRAYLGELSERVAPASMNIYIIVIRGFFGWLVNEGQILINPLGGLKVHGVPAPLVERFSDEEIARLERAAQTPLERAILFLLLDTGLRAAELIGLRLEDIDFDLGEIRVHGKGNKLRRVALNERPRQALEKYLTGQAITEGSLWPDDWTYHKLGHLLRDLGRRAKVSDVHAHRFRNTFAMLCLRKGMGEIALATLLGHKSLTMVWRYVAADQQDRALSLHRECPVA
jgi:integrase